jgi:hypothetical protein
MLGSVYSFFSRYFDPLEEFASKFMGSSVFRRIDFAHPDASLPDLDQVILDFDILECQMKTPCAV